MTEPTTPEVSGNRGWMIIAIAVGLFVSAIAYRQVAWGELQSWSIFFHGLPAVLAIALVRAGPRRTLRGRVMYGVTIGLLLAGTVAGEGLIFIVIGAPFVYLVAWAVMETVRASRKGRALSVVLPAVLVTSFLGGLASPGADHVQVSTETQATPEQVRSDMSATPTIDRVPGGFLSFGFPQPVSVEGSGLDVGDERRIMFSDDGTLVLRITASTPGRVLFEAVSDTSAIGSWIRWTTAEFSWAASGDGSTVTLELGYERRLQPGSYFSPIVSIGVHEAAEHLLASIVR